MTDVTAGRTPILPDGLPNAGTPLPGIVTAGQPDAGQLAELARNGVAIVVDLRAASEPRGFDEAAAVARAGMEYHHIPVVGGTIGPRELDAVRDVLRRNAGRSMLVHCKSANRVGAALIPYLMLDEHRTRDEAVAMARQIGLRSEELLRAALAYVQGMQGQR